MGPNWTLGTFWDILGHSGTIWKTLGAFRSQGDGPRPKIAILQNQFCHDISISKSCSGSKITILATYKA